MGFVGVRVPGIMGSIAQPLLAIYSTQGLGMGFKGIETVPYLRKGGVGC